MYGLTESTNRLETDSVNGYSKETQRWRDSFAPQDRGGSYTVRAEKSIYRPSKEDNLLGVNGLLIVTDLH